MELHPLQKEVSLAFLAREEFGTQLWVIKYHMYNSTAGRILVQAVPLCPNHEIWAILSIQVGQSLLRTETSVFLVTCNKQGSCIYSAFTMNSLYSAFTMNSPWVYHEFTEHSSCIHIQITSYGRLTVPSREKECGSLILTRAYCHTLSYTLLSS